MNTQGRIPELDGMRGIAILAVLLFHLGLVTGGYFGVDIFFVLSGFLITHILLAEKEQRGSISLRHFYYRRALRLLPALAVYLAFCLLLNLRVPLFSRSAWQVLGATLLYYANWFRALTPYRIGDLGLGPLGHTWSLAIEEQFYLTWPLLLLVFLRLKVSRAAIATLLGLLALALFAHRIMLYRSGTTWWRIYFGTDTHADGLLVGCIAALVKERFMAISEKAKKTLQITTALCCWCIAYLMMTLSFGPSYASMCAFLAVPVMSGIVILGVTIAPSPVAQAVLSSTQARYLGQRSYSLYLWHFLITEYWLPTWPMPKIYAMPVAIGISILLAELSFRFVELPFLKLKSRRISLKTNNPAPQPRLAEADS
ncbi:MAG: acyltransferase [Acidobacteriota bacterium]